MYGLDTGLREFARTTQLRQLLQRSQSAQIGRNEREMKKEDNHGSGI